MRMGKAQTIKVRTHRNTDCTEEINSTGWKTHDFLGQQFITGPETEEKLEYQKKMVRPIISLRKRLFCLMDIINTRSNEVLQRMHSKNIFYTQLWVKTSPVIRSHNHHTPWWQRYINALLRPHSTRNSWAEDLAVWCSLSLSLSAKESVQTNSPTAIFKKQHTCITKIVNRIDVRRLCS
jgi:hypothetical protein